MTTARAILTLGLMALVLLSVHLGHPDLALALGVLAVFTLFGVFDD